MLGGILGGFIIGIIHSFASYFIGGFSQIIFFAIVGIILIFKPGGLFGEAH